MRDTHTGHYVTTDAGTYDRFMRDDIAYAVTAGTLALVARDLEDSGWWYEAACRHGIIFW